jgi:hypothetical protein
MMWMSIPELPPSLRAQRSNPEGLAQRTLDCFVAALLAMTGGGVAL